MWVLRVLGSLRRIIEGAILEACSIVLLHTHRVHRNSRCYGYQQTSHSTDVSKVPHSESCASS